MLQRHQTIKNEVLGHLRRLSDLAEAVGLRTLARDIQQSRIPKLEEERFHLVVLGEFNHGKSTFVNALLGASVLPTGITPTTAAINHVVHSPAPRARVVKKQGGSAELSAEEVGEWVTVAGGHAADVAYVEVGYPSALLSGNITLVDTPGVNDLNEQRAEITYGYVSRADAILFLLDGGQALKDSEREFLSSHVIEGAKDRLLFILGKTDLLSDEEREAVVSYTRKGLAKLVPEPRLFAVSAKTWLDSRDPKSGFPELLGHLEHFLDTDRGAILLDNGAADAVRIASYLHQNLSVKLHACELDIDELEKRVSTVRKQLDASKRTLDELHGRIRAEAGGLKSQVRLDLETFSRRCIELIPPQIDKVDADDLKKYLGPFLEDKFREWAELEGANVASLLERLAEDVIAVTNENVAAASQALASRLGPGETSIDIDVDSFKYDVGVYAIGALGTTVLLFVNALAGGLLTLAAPILAIVIKSKVSGDIRVQAKERLPAVVLRAADALGPHFDRCIDDFAKRLGDFVSGAGSTLYRGITEILDQTVAERQRGEVELDGLRAETRARRDEAAALGAALRRLREGVWLDAAGSGETPPVLGVTSESPQREG